MRNPAPKTDDVDDRLPSAEMALAEFVIDDDEYPEVTVDQHRAARDVREPDRVDDIDQWLEEFAVEDCCCDSLPG